MRERLRALPKTDLHCHLDGSVRPSTALELGAKADSPERLRVSPTCGSLKEFLDVFTAIYPVLRSERAVERIAYELLEDCAADGIRYVEARFAPELQATAKFPASAVLEAAQRGLRRGFRDFGVASRVIVCLLREMSCVENARAFSALKKAFRPDAPLSEPAVVALDLAGDEAAIPLGDNARFFEEAKSLGIRTTCHAGETGTGDLDAVFALGVDRIGHAAKLHERPDLMAEAARRKLPLELNLTSNVFTKAAKTLKEHPARRYHEAGIPISFNTDDRAMMGIDLTHEYEAALQLGFSLDELAAIARGATAHAFLPRAAREELADRFSYATMAGHTSAGSEAA
jgi:adenosine deaminase